MPYNITPQDAVNLARRYKGTKESPDGSNLQMFGAWYGMNGVYWCAEFASFILYTLGMRIKGATTAKGWSYVPAIVAWGQKNKRISRTPHLGDLACLMNGNEHHVEIVSNPKIKSGYFRSIGGNTGPASISNGGMVDEHDHPISDLWYFVTPPYEAPTVHPAPTGKKTSPAPVNRQLALVSPLQTGNDIGWVQNRLKQLGFRTIPANKIYDEVTAKQVAAFQAHVGLKKDAVVGPVTLAHLQSGK
jgi:hypothetical protein